MTWKQFTEWIAFAELEPFGPERIEQSLGAIVKAEYDVHTRKKGQPPYPLKKFVLRFGDDEDAPATPKKKSWQDMKAVAQMWAATVD